MKKNIPKPKTVESSSLASAFRTIIKTRHNQAILNGHLTDGRKSTPLPGDSRRLQAGLVECDGFCIQS